jgi:hypothetical protein
MLVTKNATPSVRAAHKFARPQIYCEGMNRDFEQKNTPRQHQTSRPALEQPAMVNFPSLFSSQLDNVEGTPAVRNGHKLMMPQAQLQQV